MAELTRDFLINFQTQGGDQASRQFDKIRQSNDKLNDSLDRGNQASYNADQRIKKSISERIRQSQTYQALNQALNGSLDDVYLRSEKARKSLSSLANIRFLTLASSVGYVGYQLKKINSEGEGVNRQLDAMGIKLTSVVKQAKGLSSYGEARTASQEYITMARNYAQRTPFQQVEVLNAMATLAPVFRGDIKRINTSMRAAAVLAQSKPEQGFEGATFAIREAASGDIRSLAMRFDLSPSLLRRYMNGTSDIGSAVLAALKESGQTEEMLAQFSSTVEGMQSNIEDAQSFVAGIYNEPIFNAKKNGMAFKMQQIQRHTSPDGGYTGAMRTLGGIQGLVGEAFNGVRSNVMRPAYAWREGLLSSLAPGFARASGALREDNLKIQIKDLQDRGRYGQLDESEWAKLKELQRQLRALPAEVRKMENDANQQIRTSGTYLAKILGLNDVEKEKLIKRMRDTSDKFIKMIEDMKKRLTAGDIYKMITSIQQGLQKTFRNIIAIPTEFYKELKRTGALKFLMDSFNDIAYAVKEIVKEVFGQGKDAMSNANLILDGGKKLADALVWAINASRPVIWVMKNIIIDMLSLIKIGIGLVGRAVNGVLGAVAAGLRLVGKKNEADEVDKQRAAMEADIANSANNDPKMGRYDTGNAAQASAPQNKTWWQRKRDEYHGGFIAPIVNNSAASAVVGAVTTVMTGLFGVGVIKNIKDVFAQGMNGRRGVMGIIGGAKKLGSGFLDMLPGGAMSFADNFKLGNLLRGKGMGAAGLAGILNVVMPGNPIAQVYGMIVAIRSVIDIFFAIKKGIGGYFRMVGKGGGEVLGKLGGVKGLFEKIFKLPETLMKMVKGSFVSDVKFFTQVIDRLKTIFAPISKVGQIFKTGSSFIGRFISSAKGFFGGIGAELTKLFNVLTKIPVVGKLFSGLAKAIGIAGPVGEVVAAAKVGWDIGTWAGKKQVFSGTSMTINENTERNFLYAASKSGIIAKMMGITKEDAAAALKEADAKIIARDAENRVNRDKPKGQRHSGGYIDKSGTYTLQSGEYVLPAGGFDFHKYARKDENTAGKIGEGNSKDVARTLGTVLADNAVLAASMRYFDSLLRMMGIDPRSMGAGGSRTAYSTPPASATGMGGGGNLTGNKKADFMSVLRAAAAAGDPHPEVVAAQWALESGWGASQSGKNNYFGIKAVAGQAGTLVTTKEQGKNGLYTTQAKFADYGSLDEGITARVRMMQGNGRWTQAGYGTAMTSTEAIAALKRGGYATDSAYIGKLQGILRSAGLDPNALSSQYTGGAFGGGQGGVSVKTGDIKVDIKKGDSLDAIDSRLSESQATQRRQVKNQLATALRSGG